MTPDAARPDGDLEDRPRLPVRGSPLQTVLLVGVGLLALAGAGVAIWFKLAQKPENRKDNPATLFKDVNLSFEPPAPPWTRDDDTRAKLDAPFMLVYKRDNPDGFMAFGARDYGRTEPRPTELRGIATQALDKILARGSLKEFDPEEKTWLDQPIRGFKFRGQLKTGSAVEGEAYWVWYRGFAYWFLCWTGENDIYQELRGAFADARTRLKLIDARADWTSTRPPIVAYKNNVLGYTLLDGEGIWKEVDDPEEIKAEDPKADKLLRAKLKQKGRDFHDEAELVVYVLDGTGDPLAEARNYIESRMNADIENRGKNAFTEAGQPTGDPANPVEGNAGFVAIRSKNDRDPTHEWLFAISAIKVGDKTVAACAKCRWSARAAFDTKFVEIVKSLKADGG